MIFFVQKLLLASKIHGEIKESMIADDDVMI